MVITKEKPKQKHSQRFNREVLERGRKFARENKGRFGRICKYKPLRFYAYKGTKVRTRFLYPQDLGLDLHIHWYLGDKPSLAVCEQAHFGRECKYCNAEGGEYGSDPQYSLCYIGWVYNRVGEVFVPDKGKNKGKSFPLDPMMVIIVPQGKGQKNWQNFYEAANDDIFEESVWEFIKRDQDSGGFAEPKIVPEKVLKKQCKPEVPADRLKEVQEMTEEEVFAHIFNIFENVGEEEWGIINLTKPKIEKGAPESDEDLEDEDDEEEEASSNGKRSSKGLKVTKRSKRDEDEDEDVDEDEEEEEEKPRAKKSAKPAAKKRTVRDEEEDDEEEDEEEEDERPRSKSSKSGSSGTSTKGLKKRVKQQEQDDEDEDEEEEDDEPKPRTKVTKAQPKAKSKPKKAVEEDDEDDIEDDEDEEEEEQPRKKTQKAPVKKTTTKNSVKQEEDDEEEDEEEEDERPRSKSKAKPASKPASKKTSKAQDDDDEYDDDDEEDEAPRSKKAPKTAAKRR